MYFADKRPSRDLAAIQLPPAFGRFAGLDVPAGEKNFEISQSFTLPVDVEAIQVGGHAHYICSDMELVATLPSGKKIDLLKIDDWDLDWQDQYQFKNPLPLPAGTKLHASLHYDNSADNPENPHSPPKRIKWGRQSTDEMGSVTLQVVAANPADHKALASATTGLIRTAAREGIAQQLRRGGANLRGMAGNGLLVKRWDRDGDGKLKKSEVPERYRERVFRFVDSDKDGTLDEREIERALKLLNGRR